MFEIFLSKTGEIIVIEKYNSGCRALLNNIGGLMAQT